MGRIMGIDYGQKRVGLAVEGVEKKKKHAKKKKKDKATVDKVGAVIILQEYLQSNEKL